MSKFYNPVRLYSESNGAEQLAQAVGQTFSDLNRVLLLTRGANVESAAVLQPLMKLLQTKTVLIKECAVSNPTLADIVELSQQVSAFDYELVIAIGGGSVLDMAKTLIATKSQTLIDLDSLRTIIVDEQYLEQDLSVPWIGIPTTSGTGSELTRWATVWDTELDLKYSIAHEKLYAHSALIAPELTQHMPLHLSVITSLDALCHATEAYWSVNTNPITRVYALQSIRSIMTYLPLLKEDATNLEYRKHLALASAYAGLAFSNTMTTACHSISYPLTLMFGIEHGIAASITLGSICRINAQQISDLIPLLEAFDVSSAELVEDKVFEIYRLYGLSTSLQDYGVTEDSLSDVVERAYTKGRMNNNPVILTKDQLITVLQRLL